MSRLPLAGTHGPEAVAEPRVAIAIYPALERELDRAKRNHQAVDPAVLLFIEACRVAADWERRRLEAASTHVPGPEYRQEGGSSSSESMTVNEAATLLGITTRAVRGRCERGSLPAARDRSGRWLIDAAAVLEEDHECR